MANINVSCPHDCGDEWEFDVYHEVADDGLIPVVDFIRQRCDCFLPAEEFEKFQDSIIETYLN